MDSNKQSHDKPDKDKEKDKDKPPHPVPPHRPSSLG
jgi:hypothetical protein